MKAVQNRDNLINFLLIEINSKILNRFTKKIEIKLTPLIQLTIFPKKLKI